MLVLLGLGCGAAHISHRGLWPDVGRLLLVVLPPVLWFWLPHVNRE